MTIIVKNKETLVFEDFSFKCCIGKNGTSNNKHIFDGEYTCLIVSVLAIMSLTVSLGICEKGNILLFLAASKALMSCCLSTFSFKTSANR